MKLALMISDLDLFAIVSGYICADVMLASRDGCEDGIDVKSIPKFLWLQGSKNVFPGKVW